MTVRGGEAASLGAVIQKQNKALRAALREADALLALYVPGTSQRTDKYLKLYEGTMGEESKVVK